MTAGLAVRAVTAKAGGSPETVTGLMKAERWRVALGRTFDWHEAFRARSGHKPRLRVGHRHPACRGGLRLSRSGRIHSGATVGRAHPRGAAEPVGAASGYRGRR